jgi:hypothetical protein
LTKDAAEKRQLEKINLRKKLAANFHPNRLDMSVAYSKKKVFKANFISGFHQIIRNQMIKNKVA